MNVVGYLPPKLMYLNFMDFPFLEGWLIFEIASSNNLFSLEVVNEDSALILVFFWFGTSGPFYPIGFFRLKMFKTWNRIK